MSDEIWTSAFGLEGYYEVSDRGRIRSVSRSRRKWKGGTYPIKPYVELGYHRVMLSRTGKKRKTTLHRLILESFTGISPKDRVAAHRDGDKENNTLPNIYWATPLENQLDKHRHGTMPKGLTHGMTKLSEDQVLAIRLARKRGERAVKVAKRFKISQTHVYSICNLDSWKHLQPFNGECK